MIEGIASLSIYEKIEKALQNYSKKLRVQLSYLDIAIWVVMRVYQREFI
jgi:thermostable 8-oxoguanine DNA glycosylase